MIFTTASNNKPDINQKNHVSQNHYPDSELGLF